MLYRMRENIFDIKCGIQRAFKGYSKDQCWDLNGWMTNTLPKMIRELRDMAQGYPATLEFEEIKNFPLKWIEEESKILLEQKKKKGLEEEVLLFDENKFDRWWLILSRMAYCFEQSNEWNQISTNEYADEYFDQVFGGEIKTEVAETDKKGKPLTYRIITNEADKKLENNYKKREEELMQERMDYKKEAFDLMCKYLENMWD